MNNIRTKISAVLVILAGLTLGSCSEDFLDVSSKTEPNSQNYYKTEQQALRALYGCYDGWRQVSSNPGPFGFMIASSIMSDECYGGAGVGDGYNAQLVDRFDQAASPSDMNVYEQDWKVYYAGVFRCNKLITSEPDITWDNEANHTLYMAECRALRAIMYFDMVRLWGNIPLFTEPSSDNRAQADPKDVYALIFDDLRYAIDNIPEGKYTETESFGRITKYAAEALFARAYLFYSGYYGTDPVYTSGNSISRQEALAAVENVISSKRYELVKDFKDLWPAASLVPIKGEIGWDQQKSTYAGDANSEVILAQTFTPTQNYDGDNDANRWLVNLGLRNMNFTPYGKGWGIATLTPSYYHDFFELRDARRTASVVDMAAEGVAGSSDYNSGYKDWREYTGLNFKKYTPLVFGNGMPATNPEGTADFMINNAQPWIIVRYADVLLMAAELGSPNANDYLNMVRDRAGLPHVNADKKNILDERARELAYEGIRYWDLLRQGVEVMADAVVKSGGAVENGGMQATVSYDRAKIIVTKGLSQIPANQISLSHGVLKQNAGW